MSDNKHRYVQASSFEELRENADRIQRVIEIEENGKEEYDECSVCHDMMYVDDTYLEVFVPAGGVMIICTECVEMGTRIAQPFEE